VHIQPSSVYMCTLFETTNSLQISGANILTPLGNVSNKSSSRPGESRFLSDAAVSWRV
jgi:hypothetical protein